MHVLTFILCICVVLLAASALPAAEPPKYANDNALISLGQDGRVYLASGNYVLHCDKDGGHLFLGVAGPALRNAVANAQGIIAAGRAHFSKNVGLYDQSFNPLGCFTRVGDYNFTAPAEVAVGPSGDFYVLDQGRDQVIRFHPDGIRCAIYRIPHEPTGTGRDGYLTRFRICEQTKSLYVVNWASVRCFDIDSPEYQFTPRLRWTLDGNQATELSWGYGGIDVDEQGILYTIRTVGEEFLTSYDRDGKLLKKIPLSFGEHKPVDPTRVLGLCVANGQAYVKRKDPTELFLRFDLATGNLLNAVTLPADVPIVTPDGNGKPIALVRSRLGIPANRKKVLRVLFIGNSQVNCVRDIPDMLEEISRTAKDPNTPLILCDEAVTGGVGLEGYWKNPVAHSRLAAGGWDYVVLNEIVYSFGMTNAAKFNDYAGKFKAEIDKAGAKMVLFSTADVENKREQQKLMYADALAFAIANKCRVAGAGMAWLKAWEKDPKLDFHFTDRAHPNALGYYLNACVLYTALTGVNPTGQQVSACDAATPEQAAMMQQIAWTQYQEDRKNEKP